MCCLKLKLTNTKHIYPLSIVVWLKMSGRRKYAGGIPPIPKGLYKIFPKRAPGTNTPEPKRTSAPALPPWHGGSSWTPSSSSSSSSSVRAPRPEVSGPGIGRAEPPSARGEPDPRRGTRFDPEPAAGSRRDIQRVQPPPKASSAVAKATAENPALLQEWLDLLAVREFAANTHGPKLAKLRLMEWVIGKARGAVYPLNRDRIKVAAACLLSGGYRSAAGYLSEIQQEHIRKDCEWNESLQLAIREAVRGCNRGLGPPERAPEVRLSLLAITPNWVFAPSVTGGPRRPRRSWTVAMFWLLREIELASLTIHPTSTRCWKQAGRRRATLFLPITKMDQQGKGAARSWSCMCGCPSVPDGDVDLTASGICPVCCIWDQIAEVETATGIKRDSPEACRIPLFPTVEGNIPQKRNVVAAWSEMFGEAAVDWNPVEQDGQLGPPEWSGVDGHSPRRSGAKFLIRIGWIREGVAFLGRWGPGCHFRVYRRSHHGQRGVRSGRPKPRW